ncbi:MAG: hypothetical protein AAGF20_03245, partial [Pseudomonadota bacterium]
ARAQSASAYALDIVLEENGQVFDTPKVIVEPGRDYYIELKAGANYGFRLDIAGNTRQAALEQFERDLGRWANDFLLVNTELSLEERPEARDLPDYGKTITSSLLLRAAEPSREIRSDVPVADRGLLRRDGVPIQTLSVTIKATPFR